MDMGRTNHNMIGMEASVLFRNKRVGTTSRDSAACSPHLFEASLPITAK
jgi:hypothetical protein